MFATQKLRQMNMKKESRTSFEEKKDQCFLRFGSKQDAKSWIYSSCLGWDEEAKDW